MVLALTLLGRRVSSGSARLQCVLRGRAVPIPESWSVLTLSPRSQLTLSRRRPSRFLRYAFKRPHNRGGRTGVQEYEIRTYGRNWRSSLVFFAECPSDIAAILVAREFARKAQAVEVWFGDNLVYRMGLTIEPVERKPPRTMVGRSRGGRIFPRSNHGPDKT